MRAYESMFHALNKSYTDSGTDINYADYINGNALFCFDLTADGCANSGSHFEVRKTGNLRIKLKFAQNLMETINILVYGEFESILEITKDREVLIS